jgi:hypothetical protein
MPFSSSFLGRKPQVFKPGMPFSTQVAVRYSDQVKGNITKKMEKSWKNIFNFINLLSIRGLLLQFNYNILS